jgi:hypothetical protein
MKFSDGEAGFWTAGEVDAMSEGNREVKAGVGRGWWAGARGRREEGGHPTRGRLAGWAVRVGMAVSGTLALAGGAAGLAEVPPGPVEIPPGWEIRTIVEAVKGRHCGRPDINDRGDLVFDCRDRGDWSSSEVYLYSHGELTQITHDDLSDALPKINNRQEIVWARELDGDGDLDIVLLRDGRLEVVSAEPYSEISADVNDAGHVVWDADLDGLPNDSKIFYFDGESTRQISDNALSNQGPRINQSSQIIWTRYNFNDPPWHSDVMLHRNGETLQLTQGRKQINFVGINDVGQVVWVSPQGGLEKWDDGVTVTLLPDGDNAQINNRGVISVDQWNAAGRYYEMWLLLEERWWVLTDGPEDAVNGAINTRGEIVWQYGEFPYGIQLFTRSSGFEGDLDLDGDVDLQDFAVLESCFDVQSPQGIECSDADLDKDEDIDLDDYRAWVMMLEGPQ